LSYRLRNQDDPDRAVRMNNWTWYGILELAENYGWNPRGTVTPERMELAGFYSGNGKLRVGEYWGNETRLVLLEDALNLADALEEAFLRYEPKRLPSLHPFHLGEPNGSNGFHAPGIGVIQILIHFCQEGAFLIEKL
jgi:hypothetical protein